jgi:hypothetical protein
MSKFKILAVLLTVFNVFSYAQQPKHKSMPNVTTSDIHYWMGSGTNEAIVVLYFCNETSVAYAFGYRWNDNGGTPVFVNEMLDEITNADARIVLGNDGAMMTSFSYDDPYIDVSYDGDNTMSWMYEANGTMAPGGISVIEIHDGDVFTFYCYECMNDVWEIDMSGVPIVQINDPAALTLHTITAQCGAHGSINPIGDSTVAEGSSITYSFIADTGFHLARVRLGNVEIIQHVANNSYTVANITDKDTLVAKYAVDKNNTITTNDILYWIGEGTNEAIFAVNWCLPEIAFAWGYRFSNSAVLLSTVMEDIKATDSRFDYVDAGGFVTEITYKDSLYDLALAGLYWMYNLNESSADGMNVQTVSNGDIIEFGDEGCSVSDEFWNYVWTIPITPVKPTGNVAIHEASATPVSLFPNPANDYTTITMAGIEETITLSLVDITGTLLYKEDVHGDGNTTKKIDIRNLAKGIYFVSLQGKHTIQTKKLIVY